MIRRDSCCWETSAASRRSLRSRSVSSSSSSSERSPSIGAARQSSTSWRSPTRAASSRKLNVRPLASARWQRADELRCRMHELAQRPARHAACADAKQAFGRGVEIGDGERLVEHDDGRRQTLKNRIRRWRAARTARGPERRGGYFPLVACCRRAATRVRILHAGLLHDEVARRRPSDHFRSAASITTTWSVCAPRKTSGSVSCIFVVFRFRRSPSSARSIRCPSCKGGSS